MNPRWHSVTTNSSLVLTGSLGSMPNGSRLIIGNTSALPIALVGLSLALLPYAFVDLERKDEKWTVTPHTEKSVIPYDPENFAATIDSFLKREIGRLVVTPKNQPRESCPDCYHSPISGWSPCERHR